MPKQSHAANAKSRASAQVNKGAMSKSTQAKIDAKANRVLGKAGASDRAAKLDKWARGRSNMAAHDTLFIATMPGAQDTKRPKAKKKTPKNGKARPCRR